MTERGWSRASTPYEVRTRCRSCQYDLRGIAVGERCPECGTVVPEPPATAAVDRGRPDHRDSGLHFVAVSQYLSLVPMSGFVLFGCFGSTIGVLSVFGPLARIVALTSRWTASPLRSIEPPGFGRLLLRLACLEALAAMAFFAAIMGVLPDGARLPCLMSYTLSSVVSITTTNFRLGRIFDAWRLELPTLLARLGFVAGCLAGLSAIAVFTVRIARPNPDVVAVVTVLGLVVGLMASLLAVFAARDGVGRVEEVLIVDLIDAHAELVGRESTADAVVAKPDPDFDPLPLEPERPPVRGDLERP